MNNLSQRILLKQSESEGSTENLNDNKSSNDNWGDIFTVFMNAWDQEINRIEEFKRNKEENKFTQMIGKVFLHQYQVLNPKYNGIICINCGNILPPKSIDILIKKERVYCPYCGLLNRQEFSPFE